ncbi:MAG TPA: ATP-binding protein [Pseudomonadales bacterium]|nr:ATP-binding protein [Pseudomonadales bacterium]
MAVETLKADALSRATDAQALGFRSTAELPDVDSAMGQDRAIAAIEFGVGIQREGYNLYVAGPTGIGKRTLVDQLLARHAGERGEASDWCYVNNFEDPSRPRALALPPGKGVQLKRDMEKLIERMLVTVPNVFRGDEYRRRISDIQEEYQEREGKLFGELNDEARGKGMVVIRTPGGYTIGPVREGKLMTPAQFNDMPKEEQELAKNVIEELNRRLKSIIESIHDWQEESTERVKGIDNEFIHDIIDPMLAALKSRYQMYPSVLEFLGAAHQDMAENIWDFMPNEQQEGSTPLRKKIFAMEHLRYHVNVLVDHDGAADVPVLYEDNPTLQNVIGRIEHIAQMGTLVTNFSLIKPGALHRANGGYLVLDARKVLMNSFVWDALKRAIRSREIRIESIERILSMVSTTSLEPEPIPLDVKIVLVGDRYIYHLLKEYDPEFSLYFKVNADFSDSMDRSPEAVGLYARVIATLARREKARALSAGGVARVIDQCARDAEDSHKLSLHLGDLVDLILQADFWAARENIALIEARHVDQAIAQRRFRNNRYQELLAEQIHRGVMLLATDGMQVGQINGLSVIQLGDYAFGRPSRITATARLGAGKLIDIERETELGGPLHSKGVMILSSFLARRYAQSQPLALSASIVFEQSYGRVDGDSASMAELVALLSAIAGVPIRQDLAMTGSVNQLGEMQAIGGVNEKIEGFFDVCAARGLSGTQGVVIPASNVQHLMLKPEVVEACRAGNFHVHAASAVDDVIALLTGMPAGAMREDGSFETDSVNERVRARLHELAEIGRKHSGSGDDKAAGNGKP